MVEHLSPKQKAPGSSPGGPAVNMINKNLKLKNKKSAQEIQDEIFRKMSVDRKIELSAQLWQLAKILNTGKNIYETTISTLKLSCQP